MEAWRREYVTRNVVQLVQVKRPPAVRVSALPLATARAFVAAIAADPYEALYLLAIFCGLHMAELFGLRWRDVDLAERVVRVRQQVVEPTRGRLEIDAPLKTVHRRRDVDLGPVAYAALVKHASRPHDVDAHVFTDSNGGPLRKSNFVNRTFNGTLDRAGIERFNFHRLRHMAATLLKMGGADLFEVSQILGHANTKITAEVYVDLFRPRRRAAMGRAEDVL